MENSSISDTETLKYSSHIPALEIALSNTTGDIVELGCGMHSTNFIKGYADATRRIFHSYETNLAWYKKMDMMNVYLVHNYNDARTYERAVDLIFIDNAPAERRKDDLKYWKDNAQVIVIHDSEPESDYVYGLQEILKTFKYRKDFTPEGLPHTSIVSDFVDVSKW